MEKWIILIQQSNDENLYHPPFSITDLDQIAVVDNDDRLMFFDSIETAADYRDEHTINGQCIKLPIF